MVDNLYNQPIKTKIKLVIFWLAVIAFLVNLYDYHITKVLHIIAFISWFAGLFYLPRLMVYHVESDHSETKQTLNIMAYKLFYYIMQPAFKLTVIAGFILLSMNIEYFLNMGYWFHIKLTLVAFLIGYHFYLNRLRQGLIREDSVKSSKFYRIINEIPTVILIGIIVSIVYKIS